MFQPVDGNVNFPAQELAVGEFWREQGIYQKSLDQRAGAPAFVFYEGPPTANGMPHPGHCLTRAIKDLFPRYKTMRGYRCERKAGWDTHGLPVEVEVCKELGIHAKEEIEAYGIEPFIQKCQQSVWRYMQEWRRLTERLGFWVDLDDAYVTYHQSYVESVWWSLKNLFDRGLLYQGHKIVWWWAQGGTALSAGEVGQGYRQVADPSVYVKFPLLDDDGNVTDTSLLVWTTTPWTLPSNQFAAVHPELEYSVLSTEQGGSSGKLIVATALVDALRAKSKEELPEVGEPIVGSKLVGRRYAPPFDCYFNRPHFESLAEAGWLKGTLDVQNPSLSSDEAIKLLESVASKRSQLAAEVSERFPPKWSLEWQVVEGRFVETDTGTGVVHIAPAFGESDYEVLTRAQSKTPTETPGILVINAVAPDGKFTDEGPEYCRGRWVKDCDKDIIRDLKQRGLLFHQEQYVHEYPFCWRAEEDPLIQYPRESWFIKTTAFKDAMLENNSKINWLPEHIKDGRFGKFLESNVDWALSRERFWGTPLPIWMCSETGRMESVASYDELLEKSGVQGTEYWDQAKTARPELPDDLKVHKPYIDHVTYDSPFAKGARMQRVTEVIDCWYDSGAMPFAQWGFPNAKGSDARFESQFPADFISEAIDQTRGWFYSQLAISTLLFSDVAAGGSPARPPTGEPPVATMPYPHPFRNCIVLGLMLGEDGQKMSKSKRNYLAPDEIFDRYGADALRWYFFANQPPWTTIRYSEQAIKDSIPEFLLRLWNCYSFFVIYANIDGFDPGAEIGAHDSPPLDGEGLGEGCSINANIFPLPNSPHKGEGAVPKSYRPVKERGELDRWILSELNRNAAAVVERMDAYDNFGACQHITEFVDALSNWYVRRSRDRFWSPDKRAVEKLDAYWTLYECLVTTTKLVAPFVPFLADTMWSNLAGALGHGAGGTGQGIAESVHLCDYPTGDASAVDEALSARMNLVREIASLGRNARSAASLKVRQPLASVEVVLADTTHQPWLESHADLIADELNVKEVEFTTRGEQYISYSVVPNFKRLGPRLGKNMPAAKKLLGEIDAGKLLAELKSSGKSELKFPDGTSIELDQEDIEVRLQAKAGWAAAQGKGCVVVLATELTDELISEGVARDIVRAIQSTRAIRDCQYTDRIGVTLETKADEIISAIELFGDFIRGETLADELIVGYAGLGGGSTTLEIAGHTVRIHLKIKT